MAGDTPHIDCSLKLFLLSQRDPVSVWTVLIKVDHTKNTLQSLKNLIRKKTHDTCVRHGTTHVEIRQVQVVRPKHTVNGKKVPKRPYMVMDDEDWNIFCPKLFSKTDKYDLEVELAEYLYKEPTTVKLLKSGRKPGKGESKLADEKLKIAILDGSIPISRTKQQEKGLTKLKKEVQREYPGSEAVDELWVKCGICGEKKRLNRLRYHKHFELGHWKRCQEKREEEERKRIKASRKRTCTLDDWVLKSKQPRLDEETAPPNSSDSDNDSDSDSSTESTMSDESSSSSSTKGSHTSETEVGDTLSENTRFWITDFHRTAMMLQQLLQQGLPEDHIFHIIVKSVCEFALHSENPKEQFAWDPRYRDFITSLTHVGGHATFNLLRGPGNQGQKKDERFQFNWEDWNIPCPSERNLRMHQPPAILGNGIIKAMLLNFHQLARQSSPLYDDATCCIIAVCVSRDGMQLKPGGMVDTVSGQIVGLTDKVDAVYVKTHPSPKPAELKKKFLHEANAIFLTTLDNKQSLLVGNHFTPKGLTGQDIFQEMCSSVDILQVCTSCLQKTEATDGVINKAIDMCCTDCEECKNNDNFEPCEHCKTKGHRFGHPALRACTLCVESGTKCIKTWVAVWSSDCESIYKSAMELFYNAKKDDTLKSALELMEVCPEVVHVTKRLHGSVCNWYLYIDGDRVNAVFLKALRQDPEERFRDKVKSMISATCLYRKDRMDFAFIIEICQTKVLQMLEPIKRVITTLAPERYQLWKSNEKGVLKHPLDVGSLYKGRLHYPVDLTLLSRGLNTPTSVYYMDGIAYVCEPSNGTITYVDVTSKLKVNPLRMKKPELLEKCYSLNLLDRRDEVPTVSALQIILKDWLKRKKIEDTQNKNPALYLTGPKIKAPVAAVGKGDTLYVSDAEQTCIFKIVISQHGTKLRGHVLEVLVLPSKAIPVSISLSSSKEILYVADSGPEGGILKCVLITKTCEKVLNNNTNECKTVHGITPMDEETLLFTDREANKVKMLHLDTGNVSHVSGSGEYQSADGRDVSGSHAQPTGICIENQTMYVTDTGGQCVRMIARIQGLAVYLKHLKSTFETFSIHDRKVKDESQEHSIGDAIEQMSSIITFFDGMVENIRQVTSKLQLKPQGPEGSPAFKTIESLHMIRTCLVGLLATLTKTCPNFVTCVKLLSFMTLVVEHHFSTMRSRYPMPLVLQYSQQLLPTVQETLKSLTNGSFKYYTHRNSYYPVPESAVSFSDMHFPKKDKGVLMKKDDHELLMDWRRRFATGVRQQTVRQKSTMFSPGTLPLHCYSDQSVSSTPVNKPVQQLLSFLKPVPDSSQELYSTGTIVGINPSLCPESVINSDNIVLGYIKHRIEDNPAISYLEYIEVLTLDQDTANIFQTCEICRIPKQAILSSLVKEEILNEEREEDGPLTLEISDDCFSRLLELYLGSPENESTELDGPADTLEEDHSQGMSYSSAPIRQTRSGRQYRPL